MLNYNTLIIIIHYCFGYFSFFKCDMMIEVGEFFLRVIVGSSFTQINGLNKAKDLSSVVFVDILI